MKNLVDIKTEYPLEQYNVLLFTGFATGVNLTQQFDFLTIQGKNLKIKSFHIVPYYPKEEGVNPIDIWMDDGAGNVFVEVIPQSARIDRLFDPYDQGANIKLIINGSPVPFFSPLIIGYPFDLWLDNINWIYGAKIQSMDLQITGVVYSDLQAGDIANPFVKVVMEVFTF